MSRWLSIFLITITVLLVPIFFFVVKERDLPPIENRESEKDTPIALKMLKEREFQSLRTLSLHFPDEQKEVVQTEKAQQEIIIPVSTGPSLTTTIKYISTITKSGVKHFYFKIVRSGEILDLTESEGRKGWSLSTIERDFFILTSEHNEYKVIR